MFERQTASGGGVIFGPSCGRCYAARAKHTRICWSGRRLTVLFSAVTDARFFGTVTSISFNLITE